MLWKCIEAYISPPCQKNDASLLDLELVKVNIKILLLNKWLKLTHSSFNLRQSGASIKISIAIYYIYFYLHKFLLVLHELVI